MRVYTKKASFTNDKGEKLKYDKFYCEVKLNDLNYCLPIKIEEKFLKSCVIDNIDTAELYLKEYENKNGEVAYQPMIRFVLGNAISENRVQLSNADIFIALLADIVVVKSE